MPVLRRIAIAGVVVLVGGCSNSLRSPSAGDLRHKDPSTRIRAIRAAGLEHNEQAIPALIESLSHADPAVRFYAILALKHLTNQTYGYEYQAGPQEREAATERWREAYLPAPSNEISTPVSPIPQEPPDDVLSEKKG